MNRRAIRSARALARTHPGRSATHGCSVDAELHETLLRTRERSAGSHRTCVHSRCQRVCAFYPRIAAIPARCGPPDGCPRDMSDGARPAAGRSGRGAGLPPIVHNSRRRWVWARRGVGGLKRACGGTEILYGTNRAGTHSGQHSDSAGAHFGVAEREGAWRVSGCGPAADIGRVCRARWLGDRAGTYDMTALTIGPPESPCTLHGPLTKAGLRAYSR